MRLILDPLGSSMGKQSSNHKKKAPAKPPPEEEEIGSMNMLPPYILPKKYDAPKIIILKNARCSLVALTIPKGV